MKIDDFEQFNSTMTWAQNYIIEYEKSCHDFDPFKVLTGTENKSEKLYRESVNFLWALRDLVEKYREIRKKYI